MRLVQAQPARRSRSLSAVPPFRLSGPTIRSAFPPFRLSAPSRSSEDIPSTGPALSSIRNTLAVRFAGLVIVAVAVFAVSVYAARRAGVYTELRKDASLRGDLALQIVRQTGNVVVGTSGSAIITGGVRVALDAIPGYMVLYDGTGQRIYSSPGVRRLSGFQGEDLTQRARADLAAFDDALRRALESSTYVEFELSGDRGILLQRQDLNERKAVVGISRSEAAVSWLEILGGALIILPVIMLLAVGGAYFLAGQVLAPVDRIRREVEAITDGTSLHRRVAIEHADDEMARLTATLNEMIGRLQTSFSGLRRFTADASHELKTPLAVLRANIERAMDSRPRSNEQAVALEEALQETARMAALVDSLLTLARADEGRFEIHREPVDLRELANEVFETALILGEPGEMTVTMPNVEAVTVMGDRLRLRQLFMNLVENAIKYTPKGGKVELSLITDDGKARFAVADSGIGISAADLPHIFERFWRADRVRSRLSERGGNGLGLAICQWIAQAHGGHLHVHSRLHRGSTFTAELPIGSPTQSATGSVVSAETPSTPHRPLAGVRGADSRAVAVS
jgi:signal transduction histidine kinase